MSSETNESGSLAPINDIEPTGLLATIQRLYFYLVATISLLVGLSALLALVEVLSRVWLGDAGVSVNTSSYMREIVARSGGILLVATPIFLIHWRYIRRSHAQPGRIDLCHPQVLPLPHFRHHFGLGCVNDRRTIGRDKHAAIGCSVVSKRGLAKSLAVPTLWHSCQWCTICLCSASATD